MFLSQLILNPHSRQVRSEMARPYELHRTVMSGYIEKFTDERILYRLDISSRDGIPHLLVQSCYAPDWSKVISHESYLLDLPVGNPQIREYQPEFTIGQRLVFRLVANPTRSVKTDEIRNRQLQSGKRERGQRLSITKPDEQISWLERKGVEGGFSLGAVRITSLGEQHIVVPNDEKEPQNARHWAIRFDGELQVTDPQRFVQTLKQGIGSAKGFGYGLLSVSIP